ncbi:B12-binding domain-containing radical SAM protein [Clostridiaceae bacterium 35-E11]
MKILLTTLNSKYIHTALSLQYLYSYCKDDFNNMKIREYTINHHVDYILGEIYKGQFDILCFSCYIWNITSTLEVVKNLKKVNPKQIIVLGGPEVSFDPIALMKREESIDYIVFGEGEDTFKELLHMLINEKKAPEQIEGIVYRKGEDVFKNKDRALITNLEKIPSPYLEALEKQEQEYENKIIYYESSRGCPHNCRYCLSSTIKGVRFFPLDRVKRDLDLFIGKRVKQVKFVDRTFNTKKHHSLSIMKHLVEKDNGYTNFHFEITADLLDHEILDFLSTVREGLFQFEIGVQTTYDKTMKSIDRRVDFGILSDVVRKISSFKNIHLHLDLIAGLPYEDFNRFKQSFDDVYRLNPEKLQLGFLKLLKGSGIRKDKDLHGYIFHEEAPYEVLSNQYMRYDDILKLKMIEEMVEHFYNSHSLTNAINYLLTNFYKNPSDFYHALADYWEERGYHHISHSKKALYEILLYFYKEKEFENEAVFKEILKLDYFAQGRGSLLTCFTNVERENFQHRIHEFLHDEKNIEKYLPQYRGVPVKQILKKVHFENFRYDVVSIINNPTGDQIKEKLTTILFQYELERKVFVKAKYNQIPM